MTANRLVFLSDIHIGSNASTNWYQRDVHEPMLVAIFDYIRANAANIAEVVLLGDVLDQWTYVPEVKPPSIEKIAEANPAIFGKDGAIAKAARAMPGRITYMPGNHDMGFTGEALSGFTGEPIRNIATLTYEPEAGKGQVVCTHGHIYSIFNAPDFRGDAKQGLPLGHFITRLVALSAWRKLTGDQTVAELSESGDPTATALLGDALKAILESFVTGNASLAGVIMETLLDAVNQSKNLSFSMLDGSHITAEQVIQKYADLHERYGYGSAYPRNIYGRDPTNSALLESDARNTLGHFAEILSSNYPVIVMGHTHAPDEERHDPIFGKEHIYINSGFNCPSKPDIAAQNSTGRATFAEVTVDDGSKKFAGAIRYVVEQNGRFSVAPEPLRGYKVISRRR